MNRLGGPRRPRCERGHAAAATVADRRGFRRYGHVRSPEYRRWNRSTAGGRGVARMDAGLKRELEAKVYAGERLSRADGLALYDSDDLAWLGRLAHHRRTALGGDRVLFGVDRRLELTGDEPVAAAARLRDEEPTALYLVEGPEAEGPEAAL